MKVLCLILTALFSGLAYGQWYKIQGTVSNQAHEPLALVEVSVENQAVLNTKTDFNGHYSIQLTEGSVVLIFTLPGFKTLKMPVTVNFQSLTQDVILEADGEALKGYKVSAKKIDRSEEIIRQVIANKSKHLEWPACTYKAYIKALESETTTKKKSDTSKVRTIDQDLGLAEIHTQVYQSPQGFKEERLAVDLRGQTSGLFYLRLAEGTFNFYNNLIKIPGLSEAPILSPISHSGLLAYKYKMIKTFVADGVKYHRIKVSPGIMANALFTGELIIQDSTWTIASIDVFYPKYQLSEYDVFQIKQTHQAVQGNMVLKQMELIYKANYGKSKSSGRTIVYYSDYEFNKVFSKRFFNNEISATKDSAYERDSNYWQQIRKEPLSLNELRFLRRTDSLKALYAQKTWQDSVDSVVNKITIKKVFLTGQTFYNRSKEQSWYFKPLAFAYLPVYVAGERIDYWVGYSRIFKDKTTLDVFPRINYGLLNKDLKGSLSVSRLYDPFRRARYSINAGSDFGIINPYNSWIRNFARSNFYAHDYVFASHRQELINGLYLNLGIEWANRRSIANMTFDSRGDSLWGGNTQTIAFKGYRAFYTNITLSYTPFQKYIREPKQKLILGSRWPEFYVNYRKGMPTLASSINFDYLEYGLSQELKLGTAGVSKYRVLSGAFVNAKALQYVDYRFQRAVGPIFFANPMFAFQSLDSSFYTLNRFLEGHYLHRFNGALINKVPLVKKLNIIECVGGGFLFTQERNLKFFEAYAGVEKVIRLWKERIRIGLFYVANFNNQFSYQPQFKFTIETYDKVKNSWPY